MERHAPRKGDEVMCKSVVIAIAVLSVTLSPCMAQEQSEQKTDTAPVVTKYDKMEKNALQEELKDLQKQVLVVERTAKQARETADEAAKAYKSASDNEKPDALLRMIEDKAASYSPMQIYRETASEFKAAQSAYLDLLVDKKE
jgi:hypothetical protein